MPDNELMPNDSTNLVDHKTYDAVRGYSSCPEADYCGS